MQLDINPQFEKAFQAMEHTNKNLFITGKAGVGKSTLLSWFRSKSKKNIVVLAPTGVAALNVQGQTIHNFFNFYTDVTPEKIRRRKTRPIKPEKYKYLETLIIDEASMLRADLMDCIDVFLRMYGPKQGRSFGGVQIILIGDLFQLPPVVQRNNRIVFEEYYESAYFFSAHAFKDVEIETIQLEKIYRQQDQQFIDLLNRIRTNQLLPSDISHLNSRVLPLSPEHSREGYITLTTTNANADEVNERRLNALNTETAVSKARIKGKFDKDYYPTALDLFIKVGSQVMLLNNDPKGRWINGSLGVVIELHTHAELTEVSVRLHDSSEIIRVKPFTWEVFDFHVDDGQINSERSGCFTQLPLRLAWAVTIHKGQGKTFDRVFIDIGRGAFASGQTYVALSRCRTFEGIILKSPLKQQDIQTDYKIIEFLKGQGVGC